MRTAPAYTLNLLSLANPTRVRSKRRAVSIARLDGAPIETSMDIRRALNLEDVVRFEHHITETYKSIVRQPYNRRDELIQLGQVPNISAKHEGGEQTTEQSRAHPSDILDYFSPKSAFEEQGLIPDITQNYLDKHESFNITAQELTKQGQAFVAARNLH